MKSNKNLFASLHVILVNHLFRIEDFVEHNIREDRIKEE